MIPDLLFNRLRHFLLTLEVVGPEGEKDAFANEVIETGGTYLDPDQDPKHGTHMFEIQLHGVSATGLSEPDARRNWKLAAHREHQGLLHGDAGAAA